MHWEKSTERDAGNRNSKKEERASGESGSRHYVWHNFISFKWHRWADRQRRYVLCVCSDDRDTNSVEHLQGFYKKNKEKQKTW